METIAISSHGLSDRQVSSLNGFVENFYRLTDDPAAHSEYASQFLPNATLIVNHTTVQGEEGIVSLRKHVWSPCSSQKHVIERVIYIQKSSTENEVSDQTIVETALFGTVTTVFKSGVQHDVEWAGRAEYVSQNELEWKVSRYQVYLNTKPRGPVKI